MQKLKFIYQNWNREYYELQSEEDTCSYYKNFYKGKEFKILPQILAENTKNTEKWAKYAYEQNKYFVEQMRLENFSLRTPKLFEQKTDEIARMYNITALLEHNNQFYAYAEVIGMFFTICFIDEHNRVYLQYSFQSDDTTYKTDSIKQRFKEGNLFLVEVEVFIYPEEMVDDDWENKDYISYTYTPEGYMEVTKIFDVRGEGMTEKYVASSPVNVESNWEPYPKFGEWDSIFRMKRWKEGELAKDFKLPK